MAITKHKLNLGSGYRPIGGYINIDIDPYTNPDYILNLETDDLPVDDNSVIEVKAYHILEHLGEGFFHLIKELYRVCEHGAIVDIIVPHHFHEVFINDPTHRRPITVEGMRLFSKSFNKHCIETHDSSSCLGLAYDVDFEIVSFDFSIDPFYKDIIKRNSPEQNARLMREAVNVAVETHIQLMVIKK